MENGKKYRKSKMDFTSTINHFTLHRRARQSTIIFVLLLLVAGCTNPFAPALDEELGADSSPISDQLNVDGVFQNLQYAYTFKDTTIYGDLLTHDFTFLYKNYELGGFDDSWGRDEEMRATYNLFRNSQKLDLIWNNIVLISADSTNIIRSFNLTIILNPTDILTANGKVNLLLRKEPETSKWKIVRWIDESNY